MGKRIFFDQPSDPARAKALQQLVLKRIDEQLKDLPNLLRTQQAKAHELFGSTKVTAKELEAFLKKNDYDMYRVLKDLKGAKKTLRRALSEYLTTDADFFQRKGIFEVLLARDEIELTSTLKSFDNLVSGTKADNLARHHGHLSSLTNLLKKVSKAWRGKYNQIAADSGYGFGDEGIEQFDVIAHKPFSTFDKGPNKGKYNPKGILAEMGLKPLSKEGTTVYHRVLNKLNRLGAHGAYALGTRGVSIPEQLGHLSPEEAFRVSRNLLDVEKVQIEQGKLIHGLLKRWQSKGNYTNTEEAFLDLERMLNATDDAGNLRYPEPNVKPLLEEFEIEFEKAQPKINLTKSAGKNQALLSLSRGGEKLWSGVKEFATNPKKLFKAAAVKSTIQGGAGLAADVIPSEERVKEFREKGLTTETASNYGKDILFRTPSLVASYKAAKYFLPKLATRYPGVVTAFGTGGPKLALLAVGSELDDAFTGGQIKGTIGKIMQEARIPVVGKHYNHQSKQAAQDNLRAAEEAGSPGGNLGSFAMPF